MNMQQNAFSTKSKVEQLLEDKQIRIGMLLLFPIILLILLCPLLSPYSPTEIHLMDENQFPSLHYWFGTDDLGRDVLSRCAFGAGLSLTVGLLAAFIDILVGAIWGGVSALIGGKTDECLMRIADILYSLPYLLIVILFSVVLKQGFISLILALTFTGWVTMARLVRGQIFQLKEMDFILAARAYGASELRILFVHLLPNMKGTILVTLSLTIPSAVYTEAFLSFLGLGIQAPFASLGTMANEGLPALYYYPWRLMCPALCMIQMLLAFHFIGEGVKRRF